MAGSELVKHHSTKSREKIIADLGKLLPETKEDRKFYLSIGRFIDYYSLIEQMLIIVLHHYADTKMPVSLALFYNWRTDQTINALHKIIQVRKLRGAKITELKTCLHQISIITKVRNDLVHLGPHGHKGKSNGDFKYLSNYLLAFSRKVRRKTPISAEILDRMYSDLFEISFRLISQLMDSRPRLKNRASLSDIRRRKHFDSAEFGVLIAKLFRRSYPASRPPAWRYKQPVTKKYRRKSRANRPAPVGQPQS
jgi:hypothetical protein